MSSQLDLDQGGTHRGWVRQYLGPSVGWTYVPGDNIFKITAAGIYTLLSGVSLVTVNVAGSVTIILPSAIHPTVPAGVQPGLFIDTPITIVDIGGNALSNNILIQPASGAENIVGLTSISIAVSYGGYTLNPNSDQKGWTLISP